jgi:glycosyltransferase involved in cell wall biosynthesis
MRVSVVVPTCDRPEQLAVCLSRLTPNFQTLRSPEYAVIVSDDGVSAHAKDRLAESYPFVRWAVGPRRGPAANRNYGASLTDADLLVFIDDDCIPDANWLEAFVSAATNGSSAVFEGRTYVDRPRRTLAEGSPINEIGGNLWSCNFAIRRAAFQRLRGFDDRFPYPAMEDVDFLARCNELELGIEFVKAAGVCHPWRTEGGWIAKIRLRQSLLIFMAKHPEAKHFRSLRFWAGSIFWTVLRNIIRDGVVYRGAGLWHPVQIVAFQVTMLWHAFKERLSLLFGLGREATAPGRYRR